MDTRSFHLLPNSNTKLIHNSCFKNLQPLKKLTAQRSSLKNPTSPQEQMIVHETSIKNQYKYHEILFKPLHDLICRFFDSSLPPFIDPKHVLSGNFSPVDELPPTVCQVVEGSLPPCLDGAYIQNGPNPQFIPRGPYHIADGDGMLHSVKISGGKATFCSRFVKTEKYMTERDLGYPIFPNPIAYFLDNRMAHIALTIARIISGQFNPFINGFGPANTSLLLFAGKLFAQIESDLPYEIKMQENGDLITIGRHDFDSSSKPPFLNNMTAHPKIDPETGEAFAHGYNFLPPFLALFRIDPSGRKHEDVLVCSITKGVASYIHDFAVTKTYAIFPDLQILLEPLAVLKGKKIMRVDPGKVPRLGVIPRYAVDNKDMCWIEVPGLNMLHTFNAWEEDDGDTIVIMASNILSVDNLISEASLTHLSLEKITVDVKAKKVFRSTVSPRNLDFANINPKYVGKKNRYSSQGEQVFRRVGIYSLLLRQRSRYLYAAEMEGYPRIAGVVKLDLSLFSDDGQDCTVVGSRIFEPGCYGSEPIFVAKEPDNQTGDEDDGYLLSYVCNKNTKEYKLLVMDAKSPGLETVAAIKLPGRVTQGFHSIFVRECNLPIIS